MRSLLDLNTAVDALRTLQDKAAGIEELHQ
jgi:hypothetical protein